MTDGRKERKEIWGIRMATKNSKKIRYIICLALTLSACSGGIREQLGLERDAPDEFLVNRHAPLEMPATTALPPPQKGMHRPQEKTVETKAKEAVFGDTAQADQTNSQSSVEQTIIQKTGANETDATLRARIDHETDNLNDSNKSVVQKIMNLGSKKQTLPSTVIDAKKEYERINEKAAKGEVITGENVPEIEE